MWLAGLGFALSLIAHVASILGIALPGGPATFALHVGIFVVWIPTVIVVPRMRRGLGTRAAFESAFSAAPRWLNRTRQLIFVYGIANFLIFVNAIPKHAQVADNDPELIRGFSGHWLIFYSTAFTVLYSVTRDPQPTAKRKPS